MDTNPEHVNIELHTGTDGGNVLSHADALSLVTSVEANQGSGDTGGLIVSLPNTADDTAAPTTYIIQFVDAPATDAQATQDSVDTENDANTTAQDSSMTHDVQVDATDSALAEEYHEVMEESSGVLEEQAGSLDGNDVQEDEINEETHKESNVELQTEAQTDTEGQEEWLEGNALLKSVTSAQNNKDKNTVDTEDGYDSDFVPIEMSEMSDRKKAVPNAPSVVQRSKRQIKKPKKFIDSMMLDEANVADEKPKIIKLPPITSSNLGTQDLYIEVEIDNELFVSSLNMLKVNGSKSKYSFRVSQRYISYKNSAKEQTDNTYFKSGKTFTSKADEKVKKRKEIESSKNTESINKKTKTTEEQVNEQAGKKVKTKQGCSEDSATKKKKGRPPKKIKTEPENDVGEGEVDLKQDGTENVDAEKIALETEDIAMETEDFEDIENDVDEQEETYYDSVNLEKSLNHLTEIISKDAIEDLNESIDDNGDNSEEYTNNSVNRTPKTPKTPRTPRTPKPKKERKKAKEDKNSDKKINKKKSIYGNDGEHYTVLKSDEGHDIYQCDLCGRTTKYSGNMRDHLRTHTKETPFICTICGRGISNKANFNAHLKIHSDERPHSCHICGFAFKVKQQLKHHLRRHTGSGTHTCHLCGKQVFSSTELKRHVLQHTGENKYPCKICGKVFSHDSALSRHKYMHTGGGRHQCHYCGTIFIRKEYYKNHLAKHHAHQMAKDVKLEPRMDQEYEGYQFAIVDPQGQILFETAEDTLPVAQEEVEIATREIEIIVAGNN